MKLSAKPLMVTICLLTGSLRAEAAETGPDYVTQIKPLLVEKCSACHGALKQESDLRVDAIQLIRAGSASGDVVVPGDAGGSSLLARVATNDLDIRMPPEGEGEALDGEQVELLQQWIEQGASGPAVEDIPPSPREHWAYQQPVAADPPSAEMHPIDAFLGAAQDEVGVAAIDMANNATLLRRVTIDIAGLPPSRVELAQFQTTPTAEAYEQLVDRLLDSPAYGERWGRHWMDVWRYSDWYGYKEQLRGSQRHIWRWRDWIVESLNDDIGYDQMILAMLAGDELAPTDVDTLRATGFLARNYHNSNRNIWLDATVEHTAKAFLGLTINCARCHDHKYDPIEISDYYAMRAIFEPHNLRTERLPGQKDLKKQGLVRVYDAKPDELTYVYLAGNEKHPDKDHPVRPGLPDVFGELPAITARDLPLESWLPDSRSFIRDEEVAAAEKRLATVRAKLEQKVAEQKGTIDPSAESPDAVAARPPAPPLRMPVSDADAIHALEVQAAVAALESLNARWDADEAKYVEGATDQMGQLARTAAVAERNAKVCAAEADFFKKSRVLTDARNEKDASKREAALKKASDELEKSRKALAAARKATEAKDSKYTAAVKTYPKASTGRRTAFASWIANRQNPLTARVAVNHVWLRLMGEPLVPNVFDFGLRSPRPRHADLLDWLAVDLMEHNWSLKHLVRTVVMSDAYRRASSVSPDDTTANEIVSANESVDADNEHWWRANIRRLDAEVVRDSVLAISGSLDQTLGGPEVPHPDGEKILRRSIYIQHAYEKQMTMLVLFDAANPSDCYRRSQSVVPQQALTLANSGLAVSEARKLARILWDEAKESSDANARFIRIAFEAVLSRQSTADELDACLTFLQKQQAVLADATKLEGFDSKTVVSTSAADDPAMRARENLVHVLINHNDFVTLR